MDLGALYRQTRRRLTELIGGLDAVRLATPVPACPGWTVRDVLAHVVSIPEDAAAGRLTGLPTDDFTAEQLARLAGVPVAQLLDRWSASAPEFERGIAAFEVWPAVIDLASHEQDIRGALGEPGARDCPAIRASMKRLMSSIEPPAPIMIITEDGEYRPGAVEREQGGERDDGGGDLEARGGERWPGGGDLEAGGTEPPLTLSTSRFEAFRWRMGRRSLAQLAAMDWSAQPSPAVLGSLTIFGPAAADVHE